MCFGGSSVQAQSIRLKATIPFDFHVGSESLPAGMYEMRLIAGSAIRMVTEKGRVVAASGTMPAYNPSERAGSKLVFNRNPITAVAKSIAWYSGIGFAGLLWIFTLTLYGFWTSVAGRPLLNIASVDE
jgi:hypothetical protein